MPNIPASYRGSLAVRPLPVAEVGLGILCKPSPTVRYSPANIDSLVFAEIVSVPKIQQSQGVSQ